MANRFYVGNAGDLGDTAHWSTSSGGGGGASIPTASDNAIFDANSVTLMGQTITASAGFNCLDFNATALLHSPIFDWQYNFLSVAGDFKLPGLGGVTFNHVSGMSMDATTGTHYIDTNGNPLGDPNDLPAFTMFGVATFRLLSDFAYPIINFRNFFSDGHTIYCLDMEMNGSHPGTADFTGSTININDGSKFSDIGYALIDYDDINFTFISTNSTINFYVSQGIYGSNYISFSITGVFNNLHLMAGVGTLAAMRIGPATGGINITHSLTISTLTVDPGITYRLDQYVGFSSGETTTYYITTLNINGISGNLISEKSGSGQTGQQHKIVVSTTNASYVDVQDSLAAGTIPFYDPNGVDSGNNTNWVFSAPPATTPYFTQDPFLADSQGCVTVNGFIPTCVGITEFGIVYSNNSENPTIFDTVITYTCTPGNFSFTICNLIPGERYVFGIYTRSGSGLINYFDYRAVNVNTLIKKKRYYYKVYDSITGVYITTWSTDVTTDPRFRMIINGGAGELMVKLARTYGNFNEGVDVKLNNRVECWCMDRDNPDGTKIYTGYISAYSPVIDDESQYVDVTLLGFATRLAVHPLRDATSGLTTITYNSIEPATIMKDFIDKYHDDGGSDVFYTNTSIQNTNTVASYTFINNTLQEAVDKVIELTPENWYWYIDANGIIFLQPSNIARADHKLTIGKDLSYLSSNKRLENMTNAVTVIGGGSPTPLYNYYTRPASIALYGKWEKRLQDGRVTSNTTSDLMAKRQLDRFDTPEYRTTLRITDNNGENQLQGADIEHFFPGETIQVANLPGAPILIIQSINYTPYYIEIEAATRLPEISKDFTYLNRNVVTTAQTELPTTPTTRTV